MHILLVSDAWHPQINGVVRTLDTTRAIVEDKGWHLTGRIDGEIRLLAVGTAHDVDLLERY